MKELLMKIEGINENVKKINDQITKEEGRKEEITKQMTQLLSEYNTKYCTEGNTLSLDDMESIKKAYLQEVSKKEQEAAFMSEVITLINDGKYQEASAKLGVEPEAQKEENVDKPTNSTDFASQVNTPAMQTGVTQETMKEVSGVVATPKVGGFRIPDMSQMPDVAGLEPTQQAVVDESKVEVPIMTGNLAHNIESQPAQNIPTMPTAPVMNNTAPSIPNEVPSMGTQGVPTMPSVPVVPTIPSVPTTMGVPNAQEPVTPLANGRPFQG